MDALRAPAKLNNNPGRVIHEKYPKPNSKDRRTSGKRTIFADDEDYPVMFNDYNEWKNYRDGAREITNISRGIKPGMFFSDEEYENLRDKNKKIRKQLKIRKARKIIKFSV